MRGYQVFLRIRTLFVQEQVPLRIEDLNPVEALDGGRGQDLESVEADVGRLGGSHRIDEFLALADLRLTGEDLGDEFLGDRPRVLEREGIDLLRRLQVLAGKADLELEEPAGGR